MRRAVALPLILLLTGALTAAAQTTASASAPVRAGVGLRPISMTSAGTTDFGTLSNTDVQGSIGAAILNPNAPGPNQSTAMFSVTGEVGALVSVTCSGFILLTLNTDPLHRLGFEGRVVYSTDASNQSGAPFGCSAGGVPGFSEFLSASGQVHVWLGGRVFPDTPNPPTAGTYVGTYTLFVNY